MAGRRLDLEDRLIESVAWRHTQYLASRRQVIVFPLWHVCVCGDPKLQRASPFLQKWQGPLLLLVMGSWTHEPVPAIQLMTYDSIRCAWCHHSTSSLCNASTSSAVIESEIQVKGNR